MKTSRGLGFQAGLHASFLVAPWVAPLIAPLIAPLVAIFVATSPARAATDGFGDGDRNNDGAITADDGPTVTEPLDRADVGLTWLATRGHTASGAPKPYLTVVDDADGDADAPGLQSGYALGVEGKGSGASFAGFLREPLRLGDQPGDRIDVGFDVRGWSQSANPTALRVIGDLRVGVYQDTDGQRGQPAARGFDGADAVWGRDDGEWGQSDPGPVGDKGFFMKVPIGPAADPVHSRLLYEHNTRRFLIGQDVQVVADPNLDAQGPGGAVHRLREGCRVQLSIVRTTRGILLESRFDGRMALRGELKTTDPAVQTLGLPPETFDYLAFRISDDWDMMIDNVRLEAVAAPLPEVVVFTDTFDDADRDNNGYAVKDVDVDTNGKIGTWKSGNPAFAERIAEVADPGRPTTGLTWFAAGGFAGSDPKSNPTILNDTPAGLPDGVHLNAGLALGLEGKGRGTSTHAFFDPTPTPGVPNDQRVALGMNVGDRVRVGFDWRIWESIYAVNKPLLPTTRARFCFGLYQDTDHQLGRTSVYAGPNATPAVWGRDDGLFSGDLARVGPGSNGDHGVYVQLHIGEPVLTDTDGDGAADFTGDLARISEETNPGVSVASRTMVGDDEDLIAVPDPGAPYFPLLTVGKAYRIELVIERSTPAAYPGDPAGLFTTTVTVQARDADGAIVSTHLFGGEESLGDPFAPDPATDGVQSDVWDYLGFRNLGGDPEEDFDMIIDNVMVEVLPASVCTELRDSGHCVR